MSDRLRVLLADDEPLALERLLLAFRDIPDVEVVGTAENGIDATAQIINLKPDVAVLDIQMPGRTGLGVASGLDPDDRPDIIFITAYDQHAVDAFDVEATDYVLKPLRLGRLLQAIERVRRRRRERTAPALPQPAPRSEASDDQAFWVPVRQGRVRVPLGDIEWIEAARDYVLLHTAARSYMYRASMNAIEARFGPDALVRVHRSALVRPGAVSSVQRTDSGGATIVLSHGVAVPVGVTYLTDVRKRFQ